jgi:hypothetical protein
VPFEPDSPVTLTFFLPDGSGPFEVRGHARVLGEEAEGEGELGCLAVTFPDAPQSIRTRLATTYASALASPRCKTHAQHHEQQQPPTRSRTNLQRHGPTRSA